MPRKENVYKKRDADHGRGKPGDYKDKGGPRKKVSSFDSDELSAPRFLPKRGSKDRDNSPFSRSNFAGGKSRPGSRDKKPAGRSYDENDKNELSALAFKNRRKDGTGDRTSKFKDAKPVKQDKFSSKRENDKPKAWDNKRGKREGDERKAFSPKRDERPKAWDDKREKREGDERKSFSPKRDEKPKAWDNKREKREGDERKPFRPKYDPEVKPLKHKSDKGTKTRNERISELTGIKDEKTDIRLNKYIANSGVCSRREADELIKKGLVTVNGKVVTEMGHKVKKEDEVKFEGRKILPEPFVYILMNKPKDFITTTDDDMGRKTVMDLLADKVEQRVYPIGRLDRNTTGVLLLTNDGEVTQVLAHPSFNIKKVYHAVLDKKVSGTDLDKLVEGVELEDGVVFADAVTYVDNEDKRHVGVEIHSGKNRVVRRMFESLGYEVEKLDRVSLGIFTKKDLPRGKWRHLTQSEVGFLLKLKKQLQ